MNTPTLIASLVMAAILALLIAVLIQAMMRGWRRRAERQAELIGTLPPMPDTVGAAIVPATKGLYVGSTLVPHWNDRVAVADLGFRTKAVLTRYPEASGQNPYMSWPRRTDRWHRVPATPDLMRNVLGCLVMV